jgi:hypothetical protein
VQLDIDFDAAVIDGTRNPDTLAQADYATLVKRALAARFPEVTERSERRELSAIVSTGAVFALRDQVLAQPSLIGTKRSVWLLADDEVDMLTKGHFDRDAPASERRVSDREIAWIDQLGAQGQIEQRFNLAFFTAGDSRDPERAGIWGAVVGSALTLMVTLVLAFLIAWPYLESSRRAIADRPDRSEHQSHRRTFHRVWTARLAVFINFFGLPRSSSRRHGAHVADAAHHHHRLARRTQSRAAVDPRSGAGHGRLEDPDGGSPRLAAGHARHAHRHHHRYGARARRIRAAAHDRHGGVHRRHSAPAHGSRDRAAGADLSLGGQPGARLRGAHLRHDHGAARLSHHDERAGRVSAAAAGASAGEHRHARTVVYARGCRCDGVRRFRLRSNGAAGTSR